MKRGPAAKQHELFVPRRHPYFKFEAGPAHTGAGRLMRLSSRQLAQAPDAADDGLGLARGARAQQASHSLSAPHRVSPGNGRAATPIL